MRFKQLPISLLISTILGWLASTGLSAETIAEFTFETDVNPTTEGANVTVSAFTVGSGIPEAYHSSINMHLSRLRRYRPERFG